MCNIVNHLYYSRHKLEEFVQIKVSNVLENFKAAVEVKRFAKSQNCGTERILNMSELLINLLDFHTEAVGHI